MTFVNFITPTLPLKTSLLSTLPHPTHYHPHKTPTCIQHLKTPTKQTPTLPTLLPLNFHPNPPKRKPTKKPITKPGELHAPNDTLQSTPPQQILLFIHTFLTLLTFTSIIHHTQTPLQILQLILGLFSGYLFADLGTGIYHWAVDNYGSEHTPIFGYQIKAFQGHHKSPWTITQRQLANNLYRLLFPVMPQMLGLLVFGERLGVGVESFWWMGCSCVVLSQEFHKWAHMRYVGGWRGWLMRRGVVVAKKEHGLHHLSPYGEKYCIVSGMWNDTLDKMRVFRWLEKSVYKVCGVEPIAWRLERKLKEEALSL